MEKEYRNTIIESVDYLIELRENVFTHALDLAMKNHLTDFDNVTKEGEIYPFNLDYLDKSSDINLQSIVDLIKNIEYTVNTLINLNAIKNDELKNKVYIKYN